MKKRVATLILNRNLPNITDALVDHIKEFDGEITDIFVIESGSDSNNLSKNCTWYANWEEVMINGLRYPRGMNFGLSQLWRENRFLKYDSFFLLTNDTELEKKATIRPLQNILDNHPKLGILSPCSPNWGEILLLNEKDTMYFWYIHNNAYFLRRELIENLYDIENPNYINFLFDGNNFRGYGTEHELIAKAYANDWAAAITKKVIASENESHLLTKADLIKTKPYEENMHLYIEEGKKWMQKKYGFKSHWAMHRYAKCFYDMFFEINPDCRDYQI